MGESFIYQMAYTFGQIVGVFVVIFIFVMFPTLGIIYLVKRKKLKRKELEFKSREHGQKSHKM